MTGIMISNVKEFGKCLSNRLPAGSKPNFWRKRIVRMQINMSSHELSTDTNKVGGIDSR